MTDTENEIDGLPTRVADALELFLANVHNWEQFEGVPEKDFERLSLVRNIIEICDLPNNPQLRASCGSEDMSPKDAANVIIKRIWLYCNSELT